MSTLNATYLFESKDTPWPASSESFWTALFALFALHLGEGSKSCYELTIWHPTNGDCGTYYAKRAGRPRLSLVGLTIESLTVEPRALSKPWPGSNLVLPASAGRFSPDLVLQSRGEGNANHLVIIENKVTYQGCLADNQMENYPQLAGWLISNTISFDLLFLQSVGCCNALYNQARTFRDMSWGSNFGILFWEEVLRVMHVSDFELPGVPIKAWQYFTAALDKDCAADDA